MKLNLPFYFLILAVAFSSCGVGHESTKSNREISLQMVEAYKKCEDPVEVLDKPDKPHLLTNLSDLSFSTAYTSIYTHHIKADSLEKDSIRFLYARNIKSLIKNAFPNIEMTNDSVLLRKNYFYIAKNSNALVLTKRPNKNIEKYKLKAYGSNKQLFININSFLGKMKFPTNVSINVFDTQNNKLLYSDYLQYECDIRDYETLEKVISYGLLKLKENFE
ncbi:MAG: hypothetical protein R2785_09075 [Flavobacteriaceae bacterium]